jgi:hypothetical protein
MILNFKGLGMTPNNSSVKIYVAFSLIYTQTNLLLQ